MIGPVRGGIFWLTMEQEGEHPVCVLTRNEAIPILDNIVVATISTHIWGIPTEVRLGPGDGMLYECAVSLDNLRTVPKSLLTEEITVLTPERIHEVCAALATATSCG
ncbi:MAG TPA: type II toxin-antitoxin system PemK/MazF family toxin [Solirubrobacterales bacterium]|nr:type II toxin-antitoxin system PemK/MazF family toxin [Solirubrobacterales bacterium]